jgi:WD40 repeat protein/uncharacterized caspase-like protein
MRGAMLALAGMVAACSLPSGGTPSQSGGRDSRAPRPVLVPQLGHAGAVGSAAMSPDHRFVVTGASDGTVRLWHAETGHELRRLVELTKGVVADFSPDGERVVFAGLEALGVVDLRSNRVLWQVDPKGPVNRPVFSADGKQVLLCRGSATPLREGEAAIEVRAAATGALAATIAIEDRDVGGVGLPICAWSADRRLAAVGFKGPPEQKSSIGVWDLDAHRLVERFEGSFTSVSAVDFSPRASRLLAVADRGARGRGQLLVWPRSPAGSPELVAEGVDTATFLGSDDELAFARPLEPLPGSAVPYAVRFTRWSLSTRRELGSIESTAAKPNLALRFHNGILTAGCWTRLDLWSVADWQRRSLSNSELGQVDAIEASDDERYLLVLFKGEPRAPLGFLLDLERGEVIRETGTDLDERFALDGAGRFVVEGDHARDLRSRDVVGTGRVPRGRLLGLTADGMLLVRDGDSLALWSPLTDAKSWVWQLPAVEPGSPLASTQPGPISVRVAAVTADRRLVATANRDDLEVRTWDGGNGQPRRRFVVDSAVRFIQFSPDGSRLLASGSELRVWDVDGGNLLLHLRGAVTSARLARAGRAVVVTLGDGRVLLCDLETGEQLPVAHHTGKATAAVLLEHRGLLVSGGSDKSIQFSDLRAGRDPLLLAIPRRNQWAVIDSGGRFDASSEAGDSFVWVLGDEPIELSQLRARYYEPHLLAKYMAGETAGLRDVALFDAPQLFPRVEVHGPTDDRRFEIVVSDQGGGIGAVPVYLNGRELTPDARQLPENSAARVVAGTLRLEVDLGGDPRLRTGGENRVEVVAFERENYLRSRKGLALFGNRVRAPRDPKLWAVVVGVSDYTGNEIDLRYAAKDAVDFARALRVAGGRWPGSDRSDITLLSSAASNAAGKPTRANVTTALRRLSGAAEDDIVVVYLSGHGVSLGNESGDYYFLASEARSFGLADPEVRRRVALSGNDLAELMKVIPAAKRAIILDTCSAGRFVQVFGDSRFPPEDQERALHRLHERTGFHILAGAAAGSPSWEASRYSQGLLTHALLFGMRGAALDSQRFVDVLKLFEHATTNVPILAENIRGVQRPLHASPGGGTSFPIGRVLREDADQIPIEAERTVFVRARLHHATEFRDSLHLSELLNQRLRQLAIPDQETGRARIVFVDEETYPRAIEIAGQYVGGGRIAAILYRDEKEMRRLAASGNPDRPSEVLDDLLRQVLATFVPEE